MLNKSEGIKKYEDDALFAKSHGGPHDTSKVNVRGQRTVGTRLQHFKSCLPRLIWKSNTKLVLDFPN